MKPLIKEISPEQTYDLRLKVLKTNDNYQYQYQGDFGIKTKHFGAFNASKLIGITTVMENKHPDFNKDAIQIRGMAVLPEFQKQGIGKNLIDFVINQYQDKEMIWCNARDYAVNFYKSLGFSTFGEKFYIKNVCYHYVMYKYL